MSEPHEPARPGDEPPTEQEPAPSAASPSQPEQAEHAQVPPETPANPSPDAQATTGMPPPPGQAGHYVFVPAGASAPRQPRFGPAMGRFVRNRATHLVAAVVVGAVVGGGTVAVVDNAANHQQRAPFSRLGGPFQGGQGHRPPGFGFGGGGQGSGN